MDNSQEINWWLELAKIGIPVVTTIAVGLWVTRSNEKYKSQLTRASHQFQINHPKRVEAAQLVAPLVSQITHDLSVARIPILDGDRSVDGLGLFEEYFEKAFKNYQNLSDAHRQHRFVFDKKTDSLLTDFVSNSDIVLMWLGDLSEQLKAGELDPEGEFGKYVLVACEWVNTHLQPTADRLETEFRAILSP